MMITGNMERKTEELPVPRSEINARLKKIEGQLRGIQKMVDNERDCIDVMTQLSAVRSAMDSVVAMILRNYTSICANKSPDSEAGKDLARAVSIWLGGRV
jgi:DNA-binding FrmR family transcriptional regulator